MVTTSDGMIRLSREAVFDPKKVYESPREFARMIAKLIELADLRYMRGFQPLGNWLSFSHFDPGKYPDYANREDELGVVAYKFAANPEVTREFTQLFSTSLHYRLLIRTNVPYWNELVDDGQRKLLGFNGQFWLFDRTGDLYRVKVSFDPPQGHSKSYGLKRTDVVFEANSISIGKTNCDSRLFASALNEIEPNQRLHEVLEPLQIMIRQTAEDLSAQMRRTHECSERLRRAYTAVNDVAMQHLFG